MNIETKLKNWLDNRQSIKGFEGFEYEALFFKEQEKVSMGDWLYVYFNGVRVLTLSKEDLCSTEEESISKLFIHRMCREWQGDIALFESADKRLAELNLTHVLKTQRLERLKRLENQQSKQVKKSQRVLERELESVEKKMKAEHLKQEQLLKYSPNVLFLHLLRTTEDE